MLLKTFTPATLVMYSLLLPLIAISEAHKSNHNRSPHAALCGEFEESVELPGSTCKAMLCGIGQRVKKIGPIALHLYDVGLYVDAKAATGCLSRWKREPSENLSNSEEFYEDARQGVFEKVVILKMAREVSAKRIGDGLANSVIPRMPKGEKSAAQSKNFQQILISATGGQSGTINKGTQLGFVCKPNEMHISINGKAAGTVNGKEVPQAMVDTYLDEDTVSPTAKKDFASGIARLFISK
eukprot:100083_1